MIQVWAGATVSSEGSPEKGPLPGSLTVTGRILFLEGCWMEGLCWRLAGRLPQFLTTWPSPMWQLTARFVTLSEPRRQECVRGREGTTVF